MKLVVNLYAVFLDGAHEDTNNDGVVCVLIVHCVDDAG